MMISKNWVSIALFYNDLNKLLENAIAPFVTQLIKNQQINKYIISRSVQRGEHVLLILNTDKSTFESAIIPLAESHFKEYFKSNPAPEREIIFPLNDWFLPYPNNHIVYNDEFEMDIMETGGLQASKLAYKLLSVSSKLILQNVIDENEEWSADNLMGFAMQMQVYQLLALGLNNQEIKSFLQYCFTQILDKTQLDANEKVNLIEGLASNYILQKEGIEGFVEYLIESYHSNEADEWAIEWIQICKQTSIALNALAHEHKYVQPEGFTLQHDTETTDNLNQKFWPVFEYYTRAINTQIGIENVYEINLLYNLVQAFETINLSLQL